jgi:hypothetical protein
MEAIAKSQQGAKIIWKVGYNLLQGNNEKVGKLYRVWYIQDLKAQII